MCIEKESPQHQRQGNNCHIDADAIFTLTCCLRKASALVQMHPPTPPLPSLNVSRQRIHPSRNAAALLGPVSMSINATLTCCSEGITRARPHFAISSSSSTSTNRNCGWIHVCTWRVSRDTSSLSRLLIHVMYWCFRCIARYATKYQVTYENRRLHVPSTPCGQAGRFVGTRGVQTT